MRRALAPTLVCAVLLTAGCAAKEPASTASAPAATDARPSAPTPTASDPAGAAPATPAPVDGTREVRAAVAGLGTARTAFRWQVGAPDKSTYALTGEGRHDFARKRGTLEVGLEDAARFELVFTPKHLYMRGTTQKESVDWMSTERAGIKAQRILKAPGNDPEYLVRQVAMGEKFERVGGEDVAGTPTTHYRGALPHRALTLNMTEEAREKTDQLRDMLDGTIPATAEAWIDDRGRLVRIRLGMRIDGTIASETTLTFTEPGRPVEVDVPAHSVDMPSSTMI
ncbi:hypothetical protein ACF1BN_25630 [Streptomyces sp. NPDC014861]|uniref:hypothetical protein n=1 Tax=Streptomyces sp. NPDC014861 TaxID=3364923 RepID=UPI0036F83CEE